MMDLEEALFTISLSFFLPWYFGGSPIYAVAGHLAAVLIEVHPMCVGARPESPSPPSLTKSQHPSESSRSAAWPHLSLGLPCACVRGMTSD